MADPATHGAQPPANLGGTDPRRLIGQVISGRYRIDELIGEGGMGAVYRAEHTNMRKRLAVKVLHPEMLGLTEAVERFEREAIAGAHIEHPNVAAATDFGKLEDGSHFLVLEFLEGEDLRTVIGRSALGPERALKIARQVAMALRAAHQLGIVHRDLKPENIMLVRKDREVDVVKVLDFGIAKVPVNDLTTTRGSRSAAALTKLGMVYGTPEYMAPEQALGEEVDGRADLYALGVIVYEMLCGYRPFEADSRVALLGMVATRKPPTLADRVPGTSVPAEIEAITMRLLEKRAVDRFQDADEVVEAIEIAMLELDYSIAGAVSRQVSAPDRSGPYRPQLASAAEPPGATHPRSEATAIGVVRAASAPIEATRDPHATSLERPGMRSAPGLEPAPATARAPVAPSGGFGGLPRPALLGALGALAIGGVIVLAVALRSSEQIAALEDTGGGSPTAGPTTSGAASGATAGAGAATAKPAPAAGPRASREEYDDARAMGLAGLGPLALKYPEDPAVLKALVLAHAAAKSYTQAVGSARRLFEVSPDSTADTDVRQVLLMAASGPVDASKMAFETMATAMGARGPDLIYELSIAPGVGKFTKDRANSALKDPEVLKLATPALLIANELRLTPACSRKPLFSKAARDGDARALHYLRPLLATTGCGFFGRSDCFSCLGGRTELRAAIDAIEKR